MTQDKERERERERERGAGRRRKGCEKRGRGGHKLTQSLFPSLAHPLSLFPAVQCTEQDIRDIVGDVFGQVDRIQIIRDHATHQSKG